MILHGTEVGQGSPVALLHGLFGQARNLGALARGLAGTHRVVSLDLRNHGASPHDAAMDYATMAADVRETLAARDALPCALLGHSMGGKVAMQVALRHPDAVRRLVVADIAPVAYGAGSFHAYIAAMQALPPGPARVVEPLLVEAVPDAAVRAFLLQNRTAEGGWRIGLSEIAAALPTIEGWEVPEGARYDGPVLVVRGERSGYVRPEHRPAMRALFPAARFVALRGAGHWLHADNPGGFLQVVAGFLGG